LSIYKLTEEIVRQSVEVKFRQDQKWIIAFSNPTAGPWKKAKVIIDGKEQLLYAYKKDEDRPDLILQYFSSNTFVICEAKDKLSSMTNSIDKILDTLNNECSKIKAKIAEREHKFKLGFIFGTKESSITEEIVALTSTLGTNSKLTKFADGFMIIAVFKDRRESVQSMSYVYNNDWQGILPSSINIQSQLNP
jgi:ribosome-associated translation inhibitor RaiA